MIFVEIIVKTINVYMYKQEFETLRSTPTSDREWIPLRNWNVFTVSREYHMQVFLNLYNINWL